MNKYPPIVYKSTALRLSKAATDEVVDPDYLLSRDVGQQLTVGTDNGLALKGMVPQAAFPTAGDLCDWSIVPASKTLINLSKTYSDLKSLSGLRTETVALPLATKNAAGFMSGSDKAALEDLRSDVDALQGKGARLDTHAFTFDAFSSDPTERAAQEAELTAYAVAEWGSSDLPDNLSVHNLNGGHLFRYNLETPPEDSYWVDDGGDSVGIATTAVAGLVKAGDGTSGTVTVDSDGDMAVAGWSGVELTSRKRTSFQASPTDIAYPSEKLVSDALALKEAVANKTTSLSASSTAAQYPSAKTVWDALAAKEATANKVASGTGLSSASTDTQYPSAKTVYDALALKEAAANKVSSGTGLSGASTDQQFPSAKLVYNALQGKEDVSNKLLSAAGLSSSSTDAQYPSAKTVYDAVQAAITAAVNAAVAAAKTTVVRGAVNTTSAIASGANVTVGSYTVGSNRLLIVFNNLICRPGSSNQYVEVGTAGATSTTIKLYMPVKAGELLEYISFG